MAKAKNKNINLNNNLSQKCENSIALKITIFNIVCNFILFLVKLITSIIGGSNSIKADAFHSLSDVLVSLIVLIGIKISNKKIDSKMPFGYDKVECIVAILLSFILFDVGLIIGSDAISDIANGYYENEVSAKLLTLTTSIFSIFIKICMFSVSTIVAKKVKYGTLKADAWHQLSDALSSVGVFIGIIGTMIGIKFADSVASLIICCFIFKISIDIFIDSSKKIIDHCAPESINQSIKKILYTNSDFEVIDIKTRLFGNYIFAYIEVKNKQDYQLSHFKNYSSIMIKNIKSSILEIKSCIIVLK